MSLSEVEFFFFFLVVLALHWVLPRRTSIQNALIVAASLVFYATWNLKLLPLFLLGSVLDYVVLRRFAALPLAADEASDEEKEKAFAARRAWLYLSLASNLAVLVGFKYIGGLSGLFKLGLPSIALPLGLSFYTMSRIGIVVDTYYDRIKPVDSLLVWLAFVSFFPQLIAGPIGRSDLLAQYETPRHLDGAAVLRGLRELAIGFILKVYVAAHVGNGWVNAVFAEPGAYTRKAHVLALVGYGVQVYADFAGYSLIALGVGRFLGLGLPVNFNFPYLATNPMDLWRRWHMSLNQWLFDYVYSLMITGEGLMHGRFGLGLVVVMLVSGIWHGSAWTYVVWGLMHGLWLLAHYRYDLYYKSLCRKDRAWVARRRSSGYALLGGILTVGFFIVALVPFRSASLGGAGAFFRGLLVGGVESSAGATASWPSRLRSAASSSASSSSSSSCSLQSERVHSSTRSSRKTRPCQPFGRRSSTGWTTTTTLARHGI